MHYWVKIGDLSVQIEDFISNRISILSSISMSARTRTSSAVCVDKRQDSYLFASEYINSFLLTIIRIKLWAMRPDKRLQTVEDRNTSLQNVVFVLLSIGCNHWDLEVRVEQTCYALLRCDVIWFDYYDWYVYRVPRGIFLIAKSFYTMMAITAIGFKFWNVQMESDKTTQSFQ